MVIDDDGLILLVTEKDMDKLMVRRILKRN